MPANIFSAGVDLDTLYAPFVSASPVSNIGYQVAGVDIRTRYDPLSNPAQQNLGSRIPAVNLTTSVSGWSANTNLSSIFCGNASQYSLTTPAGASQSTGGWVSPKTWTHTITISFSSAAALTNYFFFGGRIQVSASKSTGTAADNALASMFSSMGTIVIYDQGHYQTGGAGGTVQNPSIGGGNVGAALTNLYTATDGSPYTASNYVMRMQANAAAGSATVLTITTVLTTVTAGTVADTYTGTYSSNIQQRNHPTQGVPGFSSSLV